MSGKTGDNGNYKNERRPTIVSFSKEKDEISLKDGEEDLQISLAPYIQTYLALTGEQFGCCGLCFPVPFERASRRSWWDPRFDSEILEEQYRRSSFAQIRLRFRYSMMYMLMLSMIWCVYLISFGFYNESGKEAFPLGIIFFIFGLMCFFTLLFTRTVLYRRYTLPVSIVISVCMCLLSIVSVCQSPVLSPASDFAICVEILMIIYTVIPLPLYLCVLIGTIYSVIFEILGAGIALPARILSHICVHLIALHILIMTNVRMRGTFMKVGQSLLVRRQLEMEKQLKEKMINSVMPPKVAYWLMEEGGMNEDKYATGGDIDSLFRPFNMSSMKDVSILFADIVGFTKMSSNKTASQLVSVLNELFERFDYICSSSGCEKIATLGDCYYCVSGCPTARPDHAECCIEMGLGMIKAIAEFDREKKEDVNMRVGVHTGTVLCGIVGRRRFKFDVWSNDVSLANKMESTGKPGRVHISAATKKFLNDNYVLEPGEPYNVGPDNYNHIEKEPSLTSEHLVETEPNTEPICSELPRFETITESKLITVRSSTPSPPRTIPRLLHLSDPYENKATSLPEVFASEMQFAPRARASLMGSSSLLLSKKPQQWKYSKLKLKSPELENVNQNSNLPLNTENDEKTEPLEAPNDDSSFCPSLNSRKDSGIRSNSRRSSIQQDNSKSERSYFVTPPLKRWSLLFKHPDMEKEYREKAHISSPTGPNRSKTLATARFNTYFDISISLLVFTSVSISSFIIFPFNISWMTIFLILLSIQLVVVTVCIHSIGKSLLIKQLRPLLSWYSWHTIGGVMVSLPAIAVLINFDPSTISKDYLYNYSYLLFVGAVHYCNFTQLNCWMKSTLATLGAIIYLLLTTNTVIKNPQIINYNGTDSPVTNYIFRNDTLLKSDSFLIEIYINVFCIILLVWFLNREFEISYRLSFHGNAVAAKDKAKVEAMKVQADWLVDNIIPKHVAEHLKISARYSEDVKDVGIIFASIINFGEMYDESYMDGKECLRVLNELVSDFDELLSQPRFSMVEKIKTIGCTFMAASGLDPSQRNGESNEHIFQLMEFALALEAAIETFNTHLLEFNLILRVGFNFGDVTAGVIGTSKLLYDIWGDAVNIASRMDSTGVPNRIQVPASCVNTLSEMYELEHRGVVYVKGKDNMDVYLVSGRKETKND